MVINFRNKKVRAFISQALLVIALTTLFGYFVLNSIENLNRLGIASGFDFLWTKAGFDLESPFIEFTQESLHIDAYYVGLLNTLGISVVGIVIATVLGFLMGMIRLSNNWLASRVTYVFVELTRNVPVLIWIVVWYFGVFLSLPSLRESINFNDMIFISNRGLYMPSPDGSFATWMILLSLVLGIVGKVIYTRRAKAIQDKDGIQKPVLQVSLALIVGLPVIAYIAFSGFIEWSFPVLEGFNFSGGASISPEFMALLLGLSIYTAASISEIVRSGILSVSKGQKEAAKSLNLSDWQMMKMIVIPQALIVIIPPLNSQYLNLMKNSSLAIVIGYVDLVATTGGITLAQTGQALECITLVMGTYLIISLTISMVMNRINKSVQLIGN